MKVVLSGSGMKYPAHAGALLALEDNGIDIDEIAGVSGGAIVAAAYASGFTGRKLTRLVLDTAPGPHNLIDWRWWPVSKHWGLIRGHKLWKEYQKYFVRNFSDTDIPLHVITVDLETRKHLVWNRENSPSALLATVVRASSAIPIVFNAVPIPGSWHVETEHVGRNIINVDGGVANNMPLDLFGTGKDVVGIRVKGENDGKRIPIKGVKSLVLATIETFISAAEAEHIDDAIYARLIEIGVVTNGLDFNAGNTEIAKMMAVGYSEMDKAIKSGALS